MDKDSVVLKGIMVSKSVVNGSPISITNGTFEITNNGANEVNCSIIKLEVHVDGFKKEIKDYYCYKLPHYDEITTKIFALPANKKFSLDISFPVIKRKQSTNVFVYLELSVENSIHVYSSKSSVQFITRFPKNGS